MLCTLFGLFCALAPTWSMSGNIIERPIYDAIIMVPSCSTIGIENSAMIEGALYNAARLQEVVTPLTYAAAFSTEGANIIISMSPGTCLLSRPIVINNPVHINGNGVLLNIETKNND